MGVYLGLSGINPPRQAATEVKPVDRDEGQPSIPAASRRDSGSGHGGPQWRIQGQVIGFLNQPWVEHLPMLLRFPGLPTVPVSVISGAS